MTIEFDTDEEELKQQILAEIHEEADRNNPVKQRLHVVSFMSYSAGHGRKRKPREVTLLVVDNTYAHLIKRGEVRRRKNRDFIEADVLANEVLSFLPPDERTVDNLLQILTRRR